MDGFEGNGGGYGNDDGTRDFFSQPEHSSAFNLYSDPPAQFPSSSSISAQRAGLSSLDLNSNGEAWPGMGRYENLLRYGQDEADGEGGFSPSPVRIRASGRTLGVRTARSGGGGGGMAGRAGLNSGAPCAPWPPPLSGSGTRGSSSTAPSGSVPRRGRRSHSPATHPAAMADDNFNVDPVADGEEDDLEEIPAPTRNARASV